MGTRENRGKHNRGEGNVRAKLTEEQVAEIKRTLASPDCPTQRVLAARHGVGQATISDINAERTWAWVKP